MNADTPPRGRAGKAGERKAQKGLSEIVAVVQCEGFRCMARRDGQNVWRFYHSGKVLPKVKEVLLMITPGSPMPDSPGLSEAP